ncbi:ion channel [Fulvivirgaceae bacterium BMA12]|uniref:Ion channel n=1 Tax=Agaribacillus aureus TaxID=3051825 RepID=A0ABT8KYY8_9BACT|nr:ion channel [Fulvivirgaceae bacterium BMA12]
MSDTSNNAVRLKTFLFEHRFSILLAALLLGMILPGFFYEKAGEQIVWSTTRTLTVLASINVVQKLKRFILAIAVLGFLAVFSDWINQLKWVHEYSGLLGLALSSLLLAIITYELFEQLLNMKRITINTIVAAFTGFMLIGAIGFLVFMFVHLLYPDSFSNIREGELASSDLAYFSYITLLTIGYGDIVPTSIVARGIAMFLGLVGQFYLVVIMSLLVGKYLSKR